MKTIKVVAAVIARNGEVLATQRGYGDLAGGWEFPGGKVEPGETPEEALVREIKEELDADIRVGACLGTVEHDYAKFHLSMRCYACTLADEHIVLLEHRAARWVGRDGIDEVPWLPADLKVVDLVKGAGLLDGASA